MRHALANNGPCCFANSMGFIVVAWGLEAPCAGTMIGFEYHDEPVFGRGESVLTKDGDSTGHACIMEGLRQGNAIKLVLLSCRSNAKDVMFIYESRCEGWRVVVSGNVNYTVWG